MIVDSGDLPGDVDAGVVVVGAGPAGIVLALELAKAGVDVVLVESGGRRFDPRVQRLADAESVSENHTELRQVTRRQVGGASVIWGGRCVPYDEVDFDQREWVGGPGWPIHYDELLPYYGRATNWLRAGEPVFDAREIDGARGRTLVPGLPDGDVMTSIVERWSLPTDFGREYRRELAAEPSLRLVPGLTCTEIVSGAESRVRHLRAQTLSGREHRIRAARYVIACGGLESTRLLLVSDATQEGGIGNHSGHLGHWYQTHLSGRIARIRFSTPPRETIFDHERDRDGVYVRRRFSFSREVQHRERLLNVVGWLVNPDLSDARNRNPVLSFAFLALTSPLGRYFAPEAIRASLVGKGGSRQTFAHVLNVLRGLPSALWFAVSFGVRRFLLRRRVPGFFVYSHANEYPLHFHAEQVPRFDSEVRLGDDVDEVGMRRLCVNLRFSDEDYESVVRAHELWDDYLQACGVGRVEYTTPSPKTAVAAQAGGGAHQIGTTRMSAAPEDGVVSPDLAVHGFDDLFVLSSSTFVTSSQANSTFLIVVLALRLADWLTAEAAR